MKEVDLHKYQGVWYEIARFPNWFEKDLKCVTATYSLKEKKIEVVNKGHKINDENKLKEVEGIAWIPDSKFKGRLKVSFFWPFSGDYYIIHLDQNYQYVLVGEPARKYLWVLSREKVLDQAIYKKLIGIAKENEFEINKLVLVRQDC